MNQSNGHVDRKIDERKQINIGLGHAENQSASKDIRVIRYTAIV